MREFDVLQMQASFISKLRKGPPRKPFFILPFLRFSLRNRSTDEATLNPVNLNLINDLWVPNVFIYNLKTFKVSEKFPPQAI